MRCACIDIGSNTTRVLVADVVGGRLKEVLTVRAFTRLGRELRRNGALTAESGQAVADIVADQRRVAEQAGASRLRVVATAAIRSASNRDDLCSAVLRTAGLTVDVLDGEEEAHLAFEGAVRTLAEPPQGLVGVVDVGGGSSEIAVGTAADGVRWWASVGIGSGMLADEHLRADPPTRAELDAVRAEAARAFADVDVPRPEVGVAVGGSATSMRRLVGPLLDPDTLAFGLDVLASAPSIDIARRTGLDPVRIHLLPAGLLILGEASAKLGRALQLGCGGLREGVCLHLAGSINAP
jgi:exopolyphosphatase/guanosine-5'-triphosphate,3'-diphosphate pyrophosphatase